MEISLQVYLIIMFISSFILVFSNVFLIRRGDEFIEYFLSFVLSLALSMFWPILPIVYIIMIIDRKRNNEKT